MLSKIELFTERKIVMKKTLSLVLSLLMVFSLFAFSSYAAVGDAVPFENSLYFENGDYRIHYRTYGDSSSNRGQVMLLHGFGLSTASLDAIAEQYAKENYYVVTADLPNFGYSSRETSKTVLQSREDLVFSLLEALGGKWIIGGHSMGGGIAANVAIDHPEIITGVVLYAPQTSAEATGAVSKIMKSCVMQSIFGATIGLVKIFPNIVRPLVAISFSDLDYAKSYATEKISAPLSIDSTGAGMAVMASHTRGTDLSAFSALKVPVVIVTAKNDMVANRKNLNALIDSAPQDTTVETTEKGGHMMMEYDPAGVAALTLPIMERMK